MEIPIVNEKDEIIAYKERAFTKQSDIYQVSALWITNSKNEVLLAQRSLSKKHDPGKWGPAVAGTVERGESYEKNMLKEAFEELGLKDFNYQIGPKLRRTGMHNYFVQRYIATIDNDIPEFVFLPDEIEAIAWFSKKELEKDITLNPEKYLRSVIEWISL